MSVKWTGIFVVCVFLLAAPMVQAEEITIVADEWCPFNCEAGSNAPGFMIEIATEIFTTAGHSVKYSIVGWDDALSAVRKGEFKAIVGAAREDAPDFIFPEKAQGFVSNHFFTRADSSWKFSGIESLKSARVGVIQGYGYGESFDSYFEASRGTPAVFFAEGEQPLEELTGKLLKGELDVIIEDASVYTYYFVARDLMDILNSVRDAGELEPPDSIFVAFSPTSAKSKDYSQILSRGMDELRSSGKLKQILLKYGMKDWQ